MGIRMLFSYFLFQKFRYIYEYKMYIKIFVVIKILIWFMLIRKSILK